MREIPVQFGRQWTIILPPVYRYMDASYVDQFFSDGSLRLASFARFAEHVDEQRKDTAEGKSIITGIGKDHTIMMVAGRGDDAYVMSTSTVLDTELMHDFGCNGVFEITDTISFGDEVARQLAGFKQGLQGPCLYAPKRTIEKASDDISMEKYKQEDGTISMQWMFDLHNKLGGSAEFLLKLERYKSQREYRFIWGVDGEKEAYIDIKCPGAIRFCREIDAF